MNSDLGTELAGRVTRAIQATTGLALTHEEALVRPSARAGVDYQCDVAMSLGRKVGKAPREIAAQLVEHLDSADLLAEAVVAGPGFVNLVLSAEALQGKANALLGDPRFGVPAVEPRRIAIDYGSPNVAKEMHVGHLRSAIIGDALARMLRFAGHEVLPHNHLGDWGTPFGMLIEHLPEVTGDIADLNAFYREARARFDADPEFADLARKRVVLLQSGDEATLASWQRLVDESLKHFDAVYELLGVGLTRDDVYGESFYNPYLDGIVEALKGISEISDGAVCVFPDGFTNREGDRLPLIVRKRDGGYGYAATDFATFRYWTGERGATDLLYVVGTPQAQHFAMLFAVCRQAGWLTDEQHAEHLGFGSVLGEDGKMMKTRAGKSIRLVELLTEAVERAAAIVAERSTLPETEQAAVARAIGIGAAKYADLSSDRERDYTFSYDRMLAMEGNTNVYLQYANTRGRSILAKSEEDGGPILLTKPQERELVLTLLRFPSAFASALESYAPHKLCTYLYELATAFSQFYTHCHVLKEENAEVRKSRLSLARLSSDALVLGLSLLGIETPQRL
ncbi:arginine--tRNA ligase [Amycolatopsis sp. cg5]|uniref:arginine--tRNA ligase n=1 Tax=Amycolatopsis sp. cg5 TaxID=3238802 RepID=UPI0035233220